jgi:uncharacterized protein
MSPIYSAKHLDIASFSAHAGQLTGAQDLLDFERLALEAQGDVEQPQVHWSAQASQKTGVAGEPVCWLHLQVQACMPKVCQRCLELAQMDLRVNRAFRFVESESIAEVQDEQCDEDLLVLSHDFNLLELIEDELLMEIPSIPMHEACPKSLKMVTQDSSFADLSGEKHHPFAQLARLKDDKAS